MNVFVQNISTNCNKKDFKKKRDSIEYLASFKKDEKRMLRKTIKAIIKRVDNIFHLRLNFKKVQTIFSDIIIVTPINH